VIKLFVSVSLNPTSPRTRAVCHAMSKQVCSCFVLTLLLILYHKIVFVIVACDIPTLDVGGHLEGAASGTANVNMYRTRYLIFPALELLKLWLDETFCILRS